MKRNYFAQAILLFGSIFFLFSYTLPGLVDDVLKETNQFRKGKGKAALEMRDDLNEIARKHSENMAKGKTAFGHNGFNQRFKQAVESVAGAKSFAENVAFGATSAKEVVNDWKNSSGHRANMLGKYKYIGIGIASDAQGRIYYTQVFVN